MYVLSTTFDSHSTNHDLYDNADSKVHGAFMGPTWILSAPGGSQVSPCWLQWTLLSGNQFINTLSLSFSYYTLIWNFPKKFSNISIAKCKTTVTLLQRHWGYSSPALNRRYVVRNALNDIGYPRNPLFPHFSISNCKLSGLSLPLLNLPRGTFMLKLGIYLSKWQPGLFY